MAKAFDSLPKENALATAGPPGQRSVIDAPSARLSLVGLRPAEPDSVSPGSADDRRRFETKQGDFGRTKQLARRAQDVYEAQEAA